MPMRLNPYINFRDNAREAMVFYRSVFGGELTMNTFAEFQMAQEESERDRIMHAQLEAPHGMTLMASDTPSFMEYRPGTNHSIAVSGGAEDAAELRGYWEKLCDGGTVTMPLEKAPWGDIFGMCTDRFGVAWMISIGDGDR